VNALRVHEGLACGQVKAFGMQPSSHGAAAECQCVCLLYGHEGARSLIHHSVGMSYQFIRLVVKPKFCVAEYLVLDEAYWVKRDTCEIFKWLWKYGDNQLAATRF
jgi:hypothetical protein